MLNVQLKSAARQIQLEFGQNLRMQHTENAQNNLLSVTVAIHYLGRSSGKESRI
jgi:hypothetical protein